MACVRRSLRRIFGVAAFAALIGTPPAHAQACVPPGQWLMPAAADASPTPHAQVLQRAAASDVVLLGEQHDRADHHRWQLHTMSGLHALRGQIVLGFEMFPRRLQPVLERWVAGELTEAQFLQQSNWHSVWGFDPALYLPMFHFARMHRIPMVALNVERSLIPSHSDGGPERRAFFDTRSGPQRGRCRAGEQARRGRAAGAADCAVPQFSLRRVSAA